MFAVRTIHKHGPHQNFVTYDSVTCYWTVDPMYKSRTTNFAIMGIFSKKIAVLETLSRLINSDRPKRIHPAFSRKVDFKSGTILYDYLEL